MQVPIRFWAHLGAALALLSFLTYCSPDGATGSGGSGSSWQCSVYGCSNSGTPTSGGSGAPGTPNSGGSPNGTPSSPPSPTAPTGNSAFPTTLNFGQSFSAHLLAPAFQSESITYTLKSGPAGFTVSNSGTITWTAQEFMFDSTVSFPWRIDITYQGSSFTYTGSINVTDGTKLPPLAQGSILVPTTLKSIVVEDFDHDGKNEMLLTNNSDTIQIVEHVPATGRYKIKWQYPYNLYPISGVSAHDLDGDSYKDIIIAADKKFIIFDGRTLKKKQEFQTGYYNYRCEVTSLANNATNQMVCLRNQAGGVYNTNQLVVYLLPDFSVAWQSSTQDHGQNLAVGNVDGDSQLEIVTAAGYVYDGISFANEWMLSEGFGPKMVLANVTGDNRKEIVTIYGYTVFKIYDAVTKSLIFTGTNAAYKDTIIAFNADADAYDEIITGHNQWDNVYLFDDLVAGNGILWSRNTNTHGTSFLHVGDADNDGKADLILGSDVSSSAADHLLILDPLSSGAIKYVSNTEDSLDGPFYFAGLANTQQGRRLMYVCPKTDSGYQGSRLLSWDLGTNSIVKSAQIDSNWASLGFGTLADIDKDGFDEIAFASANLYTPYFSVRNTNTFASIWTSANNLGSGTVIQSPDFNSDSYPDLITGTSEGRIMIFDVHNSAILWTSPVLNSGYAVSDLAVTDLDNNGQKDIIAATTTKTLVYEQDGVNFNLKKTLNQISGQYPMQQVALHKTAAGVSVVAIGPQNYYTTPSAIAVYDYNLQTPITTLSLANRAVKQILPDTTTSEWGRLLVLYQDNTNYGVRVGSFSISSGQEIWRSETFTGINQPGSRMRIIDPGNDGKLSIAVGTSNAMIVSR